MPGGSAKINQFKISCNNNIHSLCLREDSARRLVNEVHDEKRSALISVLFGRLSLLLERNSRTVVS